MIASTLRAHAAALRAQADALDCIADAAAQQPDDVPAAPAALLDRQGIARALGISLGSLDRLRREGLPVLRVGDAPRFVLADCVQWLRSRQDGNVLRLVEGGQ